MKLVPGGCFTKSGSEVACFKEGRVLGVIPQGDVSSSAISGNLMAAT